MFRININSIWFSCAHQLDLIAVVAHAFFFTTTAVPYVFVAVTDYIISAVSLRATLSGGIRALNISFAFLVAVQKVSTHAFDAAT